MTNIGPWPTVKGTNPLLLVGILREVAADESDYVGVEQEQISVIGRQTQ
jgi:hypothetical protein